MARIEREVRASPIIVGGRIMTVEDEQEEMVPGPRTGLQQDDITPKLEHKYFVVKLWYAPPKGNVKRKIEL